MNALCDDPGLYSDWSKLLSLSILRDLFFCLSSHSMPCLVLSKDVRGPTCRFLELFLCSFLLSRTLPCNSQLSQAPSNSNLSPQFCKAAGPCLGCPSFQKNASRQNPGMSVGLNSFVFLLSGSQSCATCCPMSEKQPLHLFCPVFQLSLPFTLLWLQVEVLGNF